MANFWATEYDNNPNPNCGGCKKLMKRVEEMTELVEAVAHIGVDFGYGEFQLSEEHIMKARKLLE